jgi:hypothetical protein
VVPLEEVLSFCRRPGSGAEESVRRGTLEQRLLIGVSYGTEAYMSGPALALQILGI